MTDRPPGAGHEASETLQDRIDRALAFMAPRRFGTLATTDDAGTCNVVPCVYVVMPGEPARVVITVDQKSKRAEPAALARIRNIRARPSAALLVSDDDDEWDRLAWARIRADARIVEPGEPEHAPAIAALREKYPPYADHDLERLPQIHLTPTTATLWSADGTFERRGFDLTATLRGRRSVRAFRPDRVPADAIRRAIGAAGWAPSPHGTQPWRFVVLESREVRTRLADAMATTWVEQLTLDGQSPEVIGRRAVNSRDRLIAPPVLVILCRYLGDAHAYPDRDRRLAEATMATQSLGAAAQNFLLSLYADGLDAGWMCAPLFCPDVVITTLDLDPALEPQAFFPVGYAARDPKRRPRRDPDDLIVRWT